jgi:BTB/POZ domain
LCLSQLVSYGTTYIDIEGRRRSKFTLAVSGACASYSNGHIDILWGGFARRRSADDEHKCVCPSSDALERSIKVTRRENEEHTCPVIMAEANQRERANGILNEASASAEKEDAAEEEEEEEDIDSTITESIRGLQKMLKKRERDLDDRAAELKRRKASLEREHPTFGAKPSDVLRLNVGGTKVDVFRRTLTSVEGSLLASQFSGRWDDSLAKDADGNFFLDQPIELFLILVNYLRDRENESHLAPPLRSPWFGDEHDAEARMPVAQKAEEEQKRISFFRMLEHYNLTLGVYPVSLYRISAGQNEQVIKGIYPGDVVKNATGAAESYVLYAAEGSKHRFHVKAFEVTIENDSKAYVGVAHGDALTTVLLAHRDGAGVGYVPESIAIDVSRHGISFMNKPKSATATTTVARAAPAAAPAAPVFSLIKGTEELKDSDQIRCEDFGRKWYVNGKLVASHSAATSSPGLVNINGFDRSRYSSSGIRWPPVVTVHKGSLRFTAIELEWIPPNATTY